ncbi:hypothetical protein R3P38DRAFT_1230857 [Favolaschia claudopus]|uniref:Uncharacterized protein n=1 Tax=Favolaschia claudopus TaxID=2862362 RepID=A0AAW0B3J6_9AGAR
MQGGTPCKPKICSECETDIVESLEENFKATKKKRKRTSEADCDARTRSRSGVHRTRGSSAIYTTATQSRRRLHNTIVYPYELRMPAHINSCGSVTPSAFPSSLRSSSLHLRFNVQPSHDMATWNFFDSYLTLFLGSALIFVLPDFATCLTALGFEDHLQTVTEPEIFQLRELGEAAIVKFIVNCLVRKRISFAYYPVCPSCPSYFCQTPDTSARRR